MFGESAFWLLGVRQPCVAIPTKLLPALIIHAWLFASDLNVFFLLICELFRQLRSPSSLDVVAHDTIRHLRDEAEVHISDYCLTQYHLNALVKFICSYLMSSSRPAADQYGPRAYGNTRVRAVRSRERICCQLILINGKRKKEETRCGPLSHTSGLGKLSALNMQ